MQLLAPNQAATLRPWFLPDQPGPLIALHVIATGHGTIHVDRWPDPRAVLVETSGNYALTGDPVAVDPADLRPLISGFVDAPDAWEPTLRTAFPELQIWDQVVFSLPPLPRLALPENGIARRLGAEDAGHLAGLSYESGWISNTWGGPETLAASGMAWGAFVEGRLAAVANVFFVGDQYEEIGIVTEAGFRGRSLSVACAGGVCDDIQSRGRQPSWTTSPDNIGSIRVAEKLGFVFHHADRLYAIGVDIPVPPRPPESIPGS